MWPSELTKSDKEGKDNICSASLHYFLVTKTVAIPPNREKVDFADETGVTCNTGSPSFDMEQGQETASVCSKEITIALVCLCAINTLKIFRLIANYPTSM